jgi:hypothetical protein
MEERFFPFIRIVLPLLVACCFSFGWLGWRLGFYMTMGRDIHHLVSLEDCL